jgi:hypothetical protein
MTEINDASIPVIDTNDRRSAVAHDSNQRTPSLLNENNVDSSEGHKAPEERLMIVISLHISRSVNSLPM